jgi:hypothetical protein
MKDLRIIAFAVAILAIAALACSPFGGGKASEVAATAKAVATEVKSAGTPAPAATATKSGSAPTSAPGGGGGDNPLSLQDRQSGLDKLKSYRMRWQAQWSSTDSGKTETASWDWQEEYSSEPKALHWIWHIVSQDQSQSADWEVWQIDNTMYMRTKEAGGDGQCTSFSSDDQNSQLTKGLFNPSMLGSVKDAKYVGTDTVNGISAKHYKYDEKSAALFGASKVAGEIWVAVEGGYVVKETVAWNGGGGLFGGKSNAKGEGKWTWELSDVNKAIPIQAPEDCGGAATDIPVMKDATDKSTFGDTLTYKTPSKLTDVVAFYQKQMPSAGWKLNGEPEVSDEMATMEFAKGDQTATIILSIEDDKTQVMITVAK